MSVNPTRWLKNRIHAALARFGLALRPIQRDVARVVYRADYAGHPFLCFKGEPVSEGILTGQGWDTQLESILAELPSHAGSHVVEVGANIGASLLPLASRFPDLTFHCIEPVPAFYELLEQNLRSFGAPNVQLYPEAIGAEDDGIVEIQVGYGTAGRSALVHHHSKMPTLRVPSQTLDRFVGDRPVGLLKVDVDGWEYEVLRGAEKVLRRDRPAIFMEWSLTYMRDVGTNPAELRELLQRAGYDRLTIWHHTGSLLTADGSWTDLEATAVPDGYLDVLFRKTQSDFA